MEATIAEWIERPMGRASAPIDRKMVEWPPVLLLLANDQPALENIAANFCRVTPKLSFAE